MKTNLIKNGFCPDRIRKIRPPVQISKANHTENTRNGPFRILFVGQLIRGKGVDLLLTAATHIKTAFKMRIAGFGNDEVFLRNS